MHSMLGGAGLGRFGCYVVALNRSVKSYCAAGQVLKHLQASNETQSNRRLQRTNYPAKRFGLEHATWI